MNNKIAQKILEACHAELDYIATLLAENKNHTTQHLEKHAVLRAPGSIETAFKQVIADRMIKGSASHAIKKKIRDPNLAPKLSTIRAILTEINAGWHEAFNELLDRNDEKELKSALKKQLKSVRHTSKRITRVSRELEEVEGAVKRSGRKTNRSVRRVAEELGAETKSAKRFAKKAKANASKAAEAANAVNAAKVVKVVKAAKVANAVNAAKVVKAVKTVKAANAVNAAKTVSGKRAAAKK